MIVGILLAAGSGTRFGGDKLLAELGDGRCIAEIACSKLLPAVDRLIAVVRPGADELSKRLTAAGAEVSVFSNAERGMGASLAHAIAQTADADGWLIALADMPLIARADAQRVADSLRTGAAIAVPAHAGRRGHPVGFARRFRDELAALDGDTGARPVIARHAAHVREVAVSDVSGWQDVDTRADLELARWVRQES